MRIAGPPDPAGPMGWPATANVGPRSATTQYIMECLLHNNGDLTYSPWLAESYQLATDKLSITFKLRKDVQFHDGTPFNAQAVKFNFDAIIAAQLTPYWKNVEIVDDYTVKVNFTSFINAVITTFADSNIGFMASPTAFQKNGQKWLEYNPVGTGAFKFGSYAPNTKTVYPKNQNYWRKGLPYLDAVELHYIMDPLTLKAACQAGQLDATNINQGIQQQQWESFGWTTYCPANSTYILLPDTANASSPLSKLEVRQAVEYCLDRVTMAKGLGFGYWVPVNQIPPRINPAWNKDFSLALPYDPAKAKELLAKAGYPNGFKTAFRMTPASRNDDADAAIQAYMKAVGIDCAIENSTQAQYYDKSVNGWTNSFNMLPMNGAGAQANFAYALYNAFREGSGTSVSWARTPEFTSLLLAALATPEPELAKIRALTDYLSENRLMIPIFESGLGVAWSKTLMGHNFISKGSFANFWNPEEAWFNK